MAANKKYEVMFSIAGKVAASFNNSFKGANKALTDANKRTKDLKSSMEGLQNLAAKGLAIGGAGLAGAGLAAKEAMKYESALNDIAVTADMTAKEVAKLDKEIMKSAMSAGLDAIAVTEAAGTLIAKGMSKELVGSMLPSLTNTAVAAKASMDDVAAATFTLNDALNVTAKDMERVQGILISTGKAGSFEYNKMAKFLPNLGAQFKSLKMEGADAAATMGAALQIAMKGAGSEDEAANNMKNFMAKVLSPTMLKSAEKLGGDLYGVITTAQKTGGNPFEAAMKEIERITKGGDVKLLGQLASDMQVQDFLRPMLQNMKEYEAIKKEALNAQNVVAMDALKQGATAEASWGTLKNQLANTAIVIGQALTPAITVVSQALSKAVLAVMAWREANPELFNTLVKVGTVIAGVIAGVSALALGLVTFIGPIVMVAKSIGGIVLVFGKLFSTLGYLSTAIPWIIEILKWLASGLWLKAIALIKMLGTAFMWLGRVFLTNPIVLAITAIIAVIWLLYKNWDTVCKYVGIAWDKIKGFFTSGINNIANTIINFSPLGLFYQAFRAVLNWFGVSLPSTFTEFGRNLLQGLANGIRSGVSAAVSAAGEAVEAVKNKVKNFFGINSPSKLFAQYGEWNMEGLAIGMQTAAPIAERASQSAIAPILPQASGQPLANNSRGSSNITVTVSQTITGGENVAEQAKAGVMDAVKQMQAHQNRNNRLSFA